MAKQDELDKIKQQILEDKVCPELAAQATQLVFGSGSPDAKLVFIGEAPGKNEDLEGKPFVGAAGKFLNEMLASIGMKREDVYITNIVKYRPPNNRDPLPEEKKAFLPYLQAQLEVIQPVMVATLGRHSLTCFLPDVQISKVHGHPMRIRIKFRNATVGNQGASAMQGTGEQHTEPYKSTAKEAAQAVTPQRAANGAGGDGSAATAGVMTLIILPLFHPAAALYNGSMRATLMDDFATVPVVLEQALK